MTPKRSLRTGVPANCAVIRRDLLAWWQGRAGKASEFPRFGRVPQSSSCDLSETLLEPLRPSGRFSPRSGSRFGRWRAAVRVWSRSRPAGIGRRPTGRAGAAEKRRWPSRRRTACGRMRSAERVFFIW